MMNPKRQYYIADLLKSNIIKDTPVTERYFRIRRYIKQRDVGDYGEKWLNANSSEIWSNEFLGLSCDGFQKLEFQNPPYSAAYRLGGDPRKYNDTFVIQVNGCNYECSYCFNDRNINMAKPNTGKFFNVKEILDFFENEREKQQKEGNQLNVIRLSGGEVTCLVPELIVDIMEELNLRALSDSVYVWADCNLSTSKYLENVEQEIRQVAKMKNFGIVGCLKTLGNEETGKRDFSLITKAKPEYFSKQFYVLDFLVNKIKLDTYVYVVPISWGDEENIRENVFSSAKRLSEINRNLPLRTNIIKIRPYDVAKINMMHAFEEGRPLPHFDSKNFDQWCEEVFIAQQRYIVKIWYDEVLPSFYGKDKIDYECTIPLN